jgi:hypothetical protein
MISLIAADARMPIITIFHTRRPATTASLLTAETVGTPRRREPTADHLHTVATVRQGECAASSRAGERRVGRGSAPKNWARVVTCQARWSGHYAALRDAAAGQAGAKEGEVGTDVPRLLRGVRGIARTGGEVLRELRRAGPTDRLCG